jgi:hypothetical protein
LNDDFLDKVIQEMAAIDVIIEDGSYNRKLTTDLF